VDRALLGPPLHSLILQRASDVTPIIGDHGLDYFFLRPSVIFLTLIVFFLGVHSDCVLKLVYSGRTQTEGLTNYLIGS
jgi:hypothetical protein